MQQKYKIFFTVILIFFFTVSNNIFCQLNVTLKQEQRGYDAIKASKILSVTQVQYKYSNGEPDVDGRNLLYNKFDSTGKCIHWIRYWPDGSKLEEINQYTYNEKGYITCITSIGMDGHIDTRTENIYDAKGNEIETNKYDTGGALMTTWIHKYDDKGREIEQTITKGSDHLPLRKVYIYDDSKNIVETDYFRQDTLTYKYVTQYSKNNMPIKEDQFTPGEEHTRRALYSYDTAGCLVENRNSYGDGKLISITKYRYNESGNIIEEEHYNSNEEPESLVKYTYEYYK